MKKIFLVLFLSFTLVSVVTSGITVNASAADFDKAVTAQQAEGTEDEYIGIDSYDEQTDIGTDKDDVEPSENNKPDPDKKPGKRRKGHKRPGRKRGGKIIIIER